MDLSNTINRPTVSSPPAKNAGEFARYSQTSINFPMLLVLLAAVISIAGAVLFWLLNSSLSAKVDSAKKSRDEKVAQMSTADNTKIAQNIMAFSDAVSQIKSALASRYSMRDFLPDIFQKINSDVTITNLSLTSDGRFNMSGSTKSYRAAAEQIMTFKEWRTTEEQPVMSNIELGAISQSVTKDGKVEVPLSISAKINIIPKYGAQSAATTGGNNAQN